MIYTAIEWIVNQLTMNSLVPGMRYVRPKKPESCFPGYLTVFSVYLVANKSEYFANIFGRAFLFNESNFFFFSNPSPETLLSSTPPLSPSPPPTFLIFHSEIFFSHPHLTSPHLPHHHLHKNNEVKRPLWEQRNICKPCNPGGLVLGIRCLRSLDHCLIAK